MHIYRCNHKILNICTKYHSIKGSDRHFPPETPFYSHSSKKKAKTPVNPFFKAHIKNQILTEAFPDSITKKVTFINFHGSFIIHILITHKIYLFHFFCMHVFPLFPNLGYNLMEGTD